MGLFKKIKKKVKKAVKKVGNIAGDIADETKNIPGVNAFTSQLALLDDPGDFLDIWKKNILPQYAVGGAGALGSMALGGALGAGAAGAGVPEGGFVIGNTIYDAAGNIFGEVGGAGVGGALSGLGGLGMNALNGLFGGGGASGLLGSLLNLGGGIYAADASKDAGKAQAEAAKQALALQREIYNQQRADQEPFRQAGLTSQNRLLDLLGLSGKTGNADYGKYARDFGMQDFQEDPGYQFRLKEGLKSLDRQAAARGGLISGAALKAASNYGQESASQEYQNAFNRYQVNRSNQINPLQGFLNQGQSATNTLGTAGQNYANQAGQSYGDIGNARSSAYIGSANALGGGLQNALGYYQNQQLVNRLPGY